MTAALIPTPCASWPAFSDTWIRQAAREFRRNPVGLIREAPSLLFRLTGKRPDPWQSRVLDSPWFNLLLLCSRQAGKSLTAALVALHQVLTEPGSLALVLSRAERQAGELFNAHLLPVWREVFAAAVPAVKRTELSLTLANGSRVVCLPDRPDNIVGFSAVSLLVVDEAARVSDELYYSVRPMLAVSKGRLLALSTPCGQRGWFHEAYTNEPGWDRVKVTAEEVPRIGKEFLAQERAKGERYFRQEFYCSFESAVDCVFPYEVIREACRDTAAPPLEL